MSDDAGRARSYFDRLAPEYDRAFRRQARTPLNALVNRAFRSATFEERMRLFEGRFAARGLQGKRVLDLGCGSGQVSLLAAALEAHVHAVDISPRMLEIARDSARRAGLETISFEEGDVMTAELPPADLVLLVGVVEYYADYEGLIARSAAAAREALVVCHTTRVPYRMLLRKLLFRLEGSSVYFHPMDDLVRAAEAAGLRLTERIDRHAFSILELERRG